MNYPRTVISLAVVGSLAVLSAAPAQAEVSHLYAKSFTPTAGFAFPIGIAINQNSGEVYVADYFGASVYAFAKLPVLPTRPTPS